MLFSIDEFYIFFNLDAHACTCMYACMYTCTRVFPYLNLWKMGRKRKEKGEYQSLLFGCKEKWGEKETMMGICIFRISSIFIWWSKGNWGKEMKCNLLGSTSIWFSFLLLFLFFSLTIFRTRRGICFRWKLKSEICCFWLIIVSMTSVRVKILDGVFFFYDWWSCQYPKNVHRFYAST